MSTSVRLLNILYTNEMEASVAFYERLGLFRKEDGEVNQWWNEFPIGDATLALHWNNGEPIVSQSNPEIHLQVSATEFTATHAAVAEMNPSGVQELEGVGRFFTVIDPNGIRVQVNEVA